jgi:hypothetical protein
VMRRINKTRFFGPLSVKPSSKIISAMDFSHLRILLDVFRRLQADSLPSLHY